MSAALPTRRLLTAASLASFALVFLAFLFYERPGLGIAHGFYVSIALLALTAGPWVGAAGGVLATALYVVAILVNPHIPPTEVPTASTAIRLVTFVAIGTLIGWYASRNRTLVGELRILAERDRLTGLPNTRAFEAAIERRLAAGGRFALLIGDLDGLDTVNRAHGRERGDDLLLTIADRLASTLAPEDEVARVGGDDFAVLASCESLDEAARLAVRLENRLAAESSGITFGWSLYPQEGDNALALYRAADERLYARKLVRGRRHQLRVVREPTLG